ncbi:unnamed protein product, partial [Ectocarpus sp. 4 AP-2014]
MPPFATTPELSSKYRYIGGVLVLLACLPCRRPEDGLPQVARHEARSCVRGWPIRSKSFTADPVMAEEGVRCICPLCVFLRQFERVSENTPALSPNGVGCSPFLFPLS